MTVRLLLFWAVLAGLAPAPRLFADLSTPKVEITYGYSGAEILVYGAVQYPGGRIPELPPSIVVTARGPEETVTVRRKERIGGIWLNAHSASFGAVPAYLSVASTEPVGSLVTANIAREWRLTLDDAGYARRAGDPAVATDLLSGLIDLRSRRGLYREQPRGVRVTENILYRARLVVPPAAPVGDYRVSVFLLDGDRVAATAAREFVVRKVGFEAGISRFAARNSFLYGLATVALAVLTGFAGSLVARRG